MSLNTSSALTSYLASCDKHSEANSSRYCPKAAGESRRSSFVPAQNLEEPVSCTSILTGNILQGALGCRGPSLVEAQRRARPARGKASLNASPSSRCVLCVLGLANNEVIDIREELDKNFR